MSKKPTSKQNENFATPKSNNNNINNNQKLQNQNSQEMVYDDEVSQTGSINQGDSMNRSRQNMNSKQQQQQQQSEPNISQGNPEQVMSTRSYLEQTVASVVQEGMIELSKARPPNPLEFLGNFILERARNMNKY